MRAGGKWPETSTALPGGTGRRASAGKGRRANRGLEGRRRAPAVESGGERRLLRLAYELARVLERLGVCDPREEDLHPVVVDDAPGPGTHIGGS